MEQEANGWFLGEMPGYKGDELPGGVSRFQCSLFAYGMLISAAGLAYVMLTKPNTNPAFWAKEHVLNVEKFKAPDIAAPFPHQQREAQEGAAH